MKLEDLHVIPDGDALLEELMAALQRYVVLPSLHHYVAVALWVAATHAQQAWQHATRLVVKSPRKRCGKTRLLEVIAETCWRPLRTTNISPAALVRSIDDRDPPTLILDEADAIFSKRRGERSEGAEDLRGILNSGHSRDWPYVRWNVQQRRAEQCPTFAMAAIGGIGDMPDTVEDRAVVIVMQRRARSESVESFRRRRSVPPLNELRQRLHAWLSPSTDVLADAEPDMPADDRAADVWDPLIAVADLAGGEWPVRARNACLALTSTAGEQDAGANEGRLLSDLQSIFEGDRMPSARIVESLCSMEEAPWSNWNGRGLSANGLASKLRLYGVRSKTFRVGNATPRGYDRSDLEPIWARYAPSTETNATSATDGRCEGPFESAGQRCGSRPDNHNGSATASAELETGDNRDGVAPVAPVSLNAVIAGRNDSPGAAGPVGATASSHRPDVVHALNPELVATPCPVRGCSRPSVGGKPCFRHR